MESFAELKPSEALLFAYVAMCPVVASASAASVRPSLQVKKAVEGGVPYIVVDRSLKVGSSASLVVQK